jgi:hypothetical protein
MVTRGLEKHSKWMRVRTGITCLIVVAMAFGQQRALRADDPCGCGKTLADQLRASADAWRLDEKNAVATSKAANDVCQKNFDNKVNELTRWYRGEMLVCAAMSLVSIAKGAACGIGVEGERLLRLAGANGDYGTCIDESNRSLQRDREIANNNRAAREKAAQDAHDACVAGCKPI